VPRLCLAGWIYEIKASFGLLKEILEGKKNELSPLSKIPPFFFSKFLQVQRSPKVFWKSR
jgi:hypothetical protein